MGKPRPFPLWATDWLDSERIDKMTPAEEGAYIRLLCRCWIDDNCSIPDDDTTLARWSRLGKKAFAKAQVLRSCFVPMPDLPGRLTNARLLRFFKEDAAIREKRRNSAESRWTGHASAYAIQSTLHMPPSPSPSPSPSPYPVDESITSGTRARDPQQSFFDASSTSTSTDSTEEPDTESDPPEPAPPPRTARKTASPLETAKTELGKYWRKITKDKFGKPHAEPVGRARAISETLLDGDPANLPEAKRTLERYLELDDPYLAKVGYPWRLIPDRLPQLYARPQRFDLGPTREEQRAMDEEDCRRQRQRLAEERAAKKETA